MNKKGMLTIVLSLLVLAAIIIGVRILVKSHNNNTSTDIPTASISENTPIPTKNLKDEPITSNNYSEIEEKIKTGEALNNNEDDFYYYTYAVLSYSIKAMQEGITEKDKVSELYIYGKTLQQIIDEGKQFMKDNNTSVEKYKKSLENS